MAVHAADDVMHGQDDSFAGAVARDGGALSRSGSGSSTGTGTGTGMGAGSRLRMRLRPSVPTQLKARVSAFVSLFLRAFLVPIVVFGVPAWPVLGLLCVVPIIGMFTVPLFLLLTVTLMYSIAWLSYLVLAQSDLPSAPGGAASGSSGTAAAGGAAYLPFLPYSPVRCLKVNWAAVQYASTALRVALPAVFDWSYRRVMLRGTQAGAGAAIVQENIRYGSPNASKRLDIYIPPARPGLAAPAGGAHAAPAGQATGLGAQEEARRRKHSTMQFTEPPSTPLRSGPPGAVGADHAHHGGSSGEGAESALAPVIVVLPSLIPPLGWTSKRAAYMQLALRLRRMGYCVVVPEVTYFPEARVRASVVDVRLALRWVADNAARYGGDPQRIHLLGHGLSAHLALLAVTQQAVVLSREKFLDEAWEREQRAEAWRAQQEEQPSPHQEPDNDGPASASPWKPGMDEPSFSSTCDEGAKVRGSAAAEPLPLSRSSLAAHEAALAAARQAPAEDVKSSPAPLVPGRAQRTARRYSTGSNSWVGEELSDGHAPGSAAGTPLPPGLVSNGHERPAGVSSLAFPSSDFPGADPPVSTAAAPLASSASAAGAYMRNTSKQQQQQQQHLGDRKGGAAAGAGSSATALIGASGAAQVSSRSGSGPGAFYVHAGLPPQTLAEAEAMIGQGLRQVSVYGADVAMPPIAGVILLAGVSDVVKGFRSESERGVEHLSVLRRAMGPGHTSCLLHSPAHLLYAAKHIIDIGLLPPKFLLIHGGRDAVVPVEQSTLLKTLLVGVGVEHIKLRAYRELGHVEALAACFLGMGQSLTSHRRRILTDIQAFVQL